MFPVVVQIAVLGWLEGFTMIAHETPHDRVRAILHVLIADPDAESRVASAQAFSGHPCDLVEALDGRDALVKALAAPPSLIVTELQLPFIDGASLCGLLRSDRATKDVPIAVVTADGGAAAAQRALLAGADVVLAKPVSPDTLRNEAERLLQGAALRERSEAARAHASRQMQRSANAIAKRRVAMTRVFSREMTTMPPAPAPTLKCPVCDAALAYEHSFVGGVSERYREQWDYYRCRHCGLFQYRQRTRTLKRVPVVS